LEELPVHVEHALASRCFMEAVNVLGAQQHPLAQFLFQPG
jgi:hypothetical protein